MVAENCTGICPADLREMRRIFDEHTPSPILRKSHAFHWNAAVKRWEIYRVPNIETTFDRVASHDGATWVED